MGKIPVYNNHGEIVAYEVEESPQDIAEWLHQEYLDRLDAGIDEDWTEEDDDYVA